MAEINTKPIHIQIRDVNSALIQNATIKVIQRKNGKILYNEKSSSGEIILDDIESLKDCHAFRVEIEHPHYKSRPKTNACCIRGANLNKPHTLEFHYQDKLLVSNMSAEIRDNRDSTYTTQNNVYDTYNAQHRNKIATIQENNNANVLYLPQRSYNIDTKATTQKEATESLKHIQIHLKAYYNQDSIPNKEEQKQYYQNQKTQTKWGYITSSPYQHTTKENINSSIKEHETFRILADSEGNEIVGEEITIHLKEEWLDRQIRFFAFIENPKYEVGVTLYIYSPSLYIEEGLIDVSGYIVGFGAAIGRGLVIKGTKFISEIQGNRYVKKESREMQGIARESLSNKDAREWYVNTQLPKMKELGNRILTLEERAKFHFNFRNQARKDTRDAMKDRKKAEELENDRKNKTWEEWIEYVKKRKGLTKMEDIYNYTIEASQRTNPDVNSKFGIKPQ
ncbi:hypothetical protein [Helicobacter trogontum]|uniref:hypothetical protein n=1 Tax=Helicobacter trogontum TaxID=50960 RepID=UPI001F30DE75|nr:hypothetical protein [Helicobacter trogontum]